MKGKILAICVVALFVVGVLTPITETTGKAEIKERKFEDTRPIIPVLTEKGMRISFSAGFDIKGKPPGVGRDKAPTVTITNPEDGATVSGTVTITVTVDDKEDGSITPDIYIDGDYVATAFSYDWDTTTVADGSHTIRAEATDSAGNTGSDTITVTVNNNGGGGGGGTGDGVVRKWALCIGIADYEGTANDLNYCDDDARDWANFLNGEGYHVVTLIDGQATADNIEAAIDELLANEDGDDYVVFTYSGHGTTYRNYGSCMISADMVYITHGWFEAKFDAADSSHIFFAFDACKIGGFKGVVTDGRVGAFASNKDYSYDGTSDMQNGVFTYYEMEGWTYYNNFEDDSAYAVQKMEEWAARYANVNVDPFYVDKYTGDMMP
ncbi:MAG: caspase family protein [Thermoplasmata archaeon]|nr:caspase family protein [Thermoplasmata archaeon]